MVYNMSLSFQFQFFRLYNLGCCSWLSFNHLGPLLRQTQGIVILLFADFQAKLPQIII